jgi:hypothetical protein
VNIVTRKSQAIPKASYRTYAAKEYKGKPFTVLPVDSHYMRNQSKDKYAPKTTNYDVLKLYRGINPSSMSKNGKYYFYDSNGTIYYETNDKNDWREIKIKRN